jgi:hypothetical protein
MQKTGENAGLCMTKTLSITDCGGLLKDAAKGNGGLI